MTDKLRINRADRIPAPVLCNPTQVWGTHRYPVSAETSTGTTPRKMIF